MCEFGGGSFIHATNQGRHLLCVGLGTPEGQEQSPCVGTGALRGRPGSFQSLGSGAVKEEPTGAGRRSHTDFRLPRGLDFILRTLVPSWEGQRQMWLLFGSQEPGWGPLGEAAAAVQVSVEWWHNKRGTVALEQEWDLRSIVHGIEGAWDRCAPSSGDERSCRGSWADGGSTDGAQKEEGWECLMLSQRPWAPGSGQGLSARVVGTCVRVGSLHLVLQWTAPGRMGADSRAQAPALPVAWLRSHWGCSSPARAQLALGPATCRPAHMGRCPWECRSTSAQVCRDRPPMLGTGTPPPPRLQRREQSLFRGSVALC